MVAAGLSIPARCATNRTIPLRHRITYVRGMPRKTAASAAQTTAERKRMPRLSPHPEPRYLAVANSLIAAISQGRYPVGSTLPTEHELCERFGISRFTAREALRQLLDAGLVVRQIGRASCREKCRSR